MNKEFDNTEKEIIKAINSIDATQLKKLTWGQLTNKIKWVLAELGENKMCCTVQASGLGDDTITEWLFDLTWLKLDENKRLKSLKLAVESEWKRELKDIQDDFEKLLVTNAEYRLMICAPKTENIETIKEYFEHAVKNYKLLSKGARFLIAIFDDCETGEIEFYSIIK